MNRLLFIFSILLLPAASNFAQPRMLKGIITNRFTNQPIAGLNVYTYFATTTTDGLGRFALPLDSCRRCSPGDRIDIYTNNRVYGAYETPCILNRDFHFDFSIPVTPDSLFITGMVMNINNNMPIKNIYVKAFSERMEKHSADVSTNEYGIFKIPLDKSLVRNEKFIRIQPHDPTGRYQPQYGGMPIPYNIGAFNIVYMVKPDMPGVQVNGFKELNDVFVRTGDTVQIRASGSISFNKTGGSSDPGGRLTDQWTLPLRQYNLVHYIPQHAALLYRIGSGDKWRYAGKDITFIADQDGHLQFEVNDNNQSNNKGFYLVEVKVSQ